MKLRLCSGNIDRSPVPNYLAFCIHRETLLAYLKGLYFGWHQFWDMQSDCMEEDTKYWLCTFRLALTEVQDYRAWLLWGVWHHCEYNGWSAWFQPSNKSNQRKGQYFRHHKWLVLWTSGDQMKGEHLFFDIEEMNMQWKWIKIKLMLWYLLHWTKSIEGSWKYRDMRWFLWNGELHALERSLVITMVIEYVHFDGPVEPDEQNIPATSFSKSWFSGLEEEIWFWFEAKVWFQVSDQVFSSNFGILGPYFIWCLIAITHDWAPEIALKRFS